MEQKKIMVIEDEKPIADILKYGFEKEGFEVTCAYTGGICAGYGALGLDASGYSRCRCVPDADRTV